jgi:esterase/lipase superfamily enzyme
MTAKTPNSKRGGPRPGAGRKKGTKNPTTIAKEAVLAEVLTRAVENETTPLEVMLTIMRDPESPPAMKFEAAKAAAPYVHPRLSQVDSRVTKVTEVAELTPEQIDRLLADGLAAREAQEAAGKTGSDRVH